MQFNPAIPSIGQGDIDTRNGHVTAKANPEPSKVGSAPDSAPFSLDEGSSIASQDFGFPVAHTEARVAHAREAGHQNDPDLAVSGNKDTKPTPDPDANPILSEHRMAASQPNRSRHEEAMPAVNPPSKPSVAQPDKGNRALASNIGSLSARNLQNASGTPLPPAGQMPIAREGGRLREMIPPVDPPQANKGGAYPDTSLRDLSRSDPAKHVRADLAAFGTASPSTTPAHFAPTQSGVLASPNAGQPPLSNHEGVQPTPSPHSEHLAADPTAPSLKSPPPVATSHDHTKSTSHPPTADLRGQNAPQEPAPLAGQIRNASQNTVPHPSLPVVGSIPLATAQMQTGTIGTPVNPVDDSAGLNDAVTSTDDPKFELTTSHLREASQPSQPTRALPDLPRHIAAQLADIVRTAPDKPVELTLNPEELGRLRMSFQTDASSLTVVLQVERPETLDLMRRHIEQLAQEMHDLGYDQVNFTFQQQQQDAASNGQADADPDTRSTPCTDGLGDQTVAQDKVQIHISPGAGMDIRI